VGSRQWAVGSNGRYLPMGEDRIIIFDMVRMLGIGRKITLGVLMLILSILMVSGCRKKSTVSMPTPAPAPSANVGNTTPPSAIIPGTPSLPGAESTSAATLPKIVPMPNYFESAERSFQAGDYRQAIQTYETFFKTTPKSKDSDQALFHLGLSRALANDSTRDLRQAEAAFRRLIAEFPQSPYRSQAEWILGLQGQIDKLRIDVKERDEKIRRLSEELHKLKTIDMQRRPSKTKE
jgi:hypothetical protein